MLVRKTGSLLALFALAAALAATPAVAAKKCPKLCKSIINTCKAGVPPNSSCTTAPKGPCKKALKQQRSACKRDTINACKADTTNTTSCGGSTTTTIPGNVCPANAAGGPELGRFTVLDNGTDLDNGWTGTSQNFPTPAGSQLSYCLSGCDKTGTTPVCQASGPVGAGSLNGETFGPPLPLVAGGISVCVINRYQGPITGTLNLQTGDNAGQVNLFSDVYVTDAQLVCPQCRGGQCDSGKSRNQACTVDGQVEVVNSIATDKTFLLSKNCLPSGSPVGTLDIRLPLTTGTVSTPGAGGSKPCQENLANGVPVQDDACGPSGCGAPCTGNACKTTDALGRCIDVKGGISQLCCNGQTSTPCFPTRNGTIQRTGTAAIPAPAYPDPTYPKSVNGNVNVATFCIAATSAFNVDQVTGLPGPGALILNNTLEVLDTVP